MFWGFLSTFNHLNDLYPILYFISTCMQYIYVMSFKSVYFYRGPSLVAGHCQWWSHPLSECIWCNHQEGGAVPGSSVNRPHFRAGNPSGQSWYGGSHHHYVRNIIWIITWNPDYHLFLRMKFWLSLLCKKWNFDYHYYLRVEIRSIITM